MVFFRVKHWLAACALSTCTLFICCQKNTPEKAPPDNAPQTTDMIMGKYGCFGCHSLGTTSYSAPSFKGLYGRTTKLKSGASIVVDEAYLRKSILDPSSDVVVGYVSGLMPIIKMSDEELTQIVEYLKKL